MTSCSRLARSACRVPSSRAEQASNSVFARRRYGYVCTALVSSARRRHGRPAGRGATHARRRASGGLYGPQLHRGATRPGDRPDSARPRSEEHTSELQSHHDLVCRLLLEKKKKKKTKSTKKKKK